MKPDTKPASAARLMPRDDRMWQRHLQSMERAKRADPVIAAVLEDDSFHKLVAQAVTQVQLVGYPSLCSWMRLDTGTSWLKLHRRCIPGDSRWMPTVHKDHGASGTSGTHAEFRLKLTGLGCWSVSGS